MDLIYSLSKMQQLLIDFYNLTHFRIALFDSNFHELSAYPTRLSSFCKEIRSDDNLNQKCKICDYNGFSSCKAQCKTLVYQCHIGLSEIIVPIRSNSMTIGYIMCGQIFSSNDKNEMWKNIENNLIGTEIDFSKLKNTYKNNKITKPDTLESVKNFMEIIAYYLYQSQNVSIKKDSLAYKIDTYIMDHLTENLSAEKLAHKFYYQKTTFYKVTDELYGMGIMKHIRQMRIQKAKEYLSSTNIHINEVASLVGINDYNYFTKVFKKETNCTPKEYRANIIKEPDVLNAKRN